MEGDRDQRVAQLQAEVARLQAAIDSLAGMDEAQRPLRAQLADKQQRLAALQQQSGGVNFGVGTVIGQTGDIVAGDKHVYHYGAPGTPDGDTLLREYLLSLAGACNRLSLADADSSDPARVAVALDAVYTGLEVAGTVPLTEEQRKQRPGEQHRQRTALEALARQQRLVLLGEPGGGKSTFVNFLGLCLAHAALGRAGWLERLGPGWPHGALLPIRVVLREFAAWVAALPTRSARGGATLLWSWLAAQHGEALAAALRREVAAGRALLLLDGLDEVPADAQGQPLTLVRGAIRTIGDVADPSHVLVTCRVLDYQQPSRQLLRWPDETLIPFSDALRHAFIGHWYEVLARLDRPLNGDPSMLCERLRSEVRDRPELRRLAGNPLLLTMMTLLHAYEGRLPEERVRLYEKCIEFLLHRWRAPRDQAPLRDQLGLPQWSESDLGRLLDRLGFAAHTRGVSGDGETGADLPRPVLIETARAFFAAYDPEQDYTRAEIFCRYVRRHSNGVLQQYGPDTYRFPHRTFQEYLAARRLTGDGDWSAAEAEFVDRALARAAEGPQWREALLLAVSRLVVMGEQTRPAADLAEALLDQHPEATPEWARNAILAGEVLAEVGRDRVARLELRRAKLWDRAVAALVEVLEHLDAQGEPLLPILERVRAGQVLGQLGDPRFPVTIDEWRQQPFPTSFGQTGSYWCYVRPGSYRIGGWEEGEPSAEITLPQFWIARFPITVAQYAPFVAEGYGESAQRWWTPNGWRWKQEQQRTQPGYWDYGRFTGPNRPVIYVSRYEAMAFCAWLTEQLAERLTDGCVICLATEAEWEAAAAYDAAGQRRSYPWGEQEPTLERAIYDASGLAASAPVGCCPAGMAACGALDLAGNAWEWAANSHLAYPEVSAIAQKDFTVHQYDVPLRGGSWVDNSTSVRCGARRNFRAGTSSNIDGFRVLLAPRLARSC